MVVTANPSKQNFLADYIANTGVAISDDSNINETASDGSTTDEITKVDTMGDESKVSKVPVISLNDFIAFSP
jgi:hypothetical protein